MKRTTLFKACRVALVALLVVALSNPVVFARTQLKNICRIKGQEENTLRGLGLVVGLNGTGEANDANTMRALSQAMQVLGNPVSLDPSQSALNDVKKIKNVAIVMVSATVPATGGRRGDKVDCYVSAINGKSLD